MYSSSFSKLDTLSLLSSSGISIVVELFLCSSLLVELVFEEDWVSCLFVEIFEDDFSSFSFSFVFALDWELLVSLLIVFSFSVDFSLSESSFIESSLYLYQLSWINFL